MTYENDISMGISIFLPTMSCGAEISRLDIDSYNNHIEDFLTKNNVSENDKIDVLIRNEIAPRANKIVSGKCKDVNDETIHMSLIFAYLFLTLKKIDLHTLRGIVAIIDDNEQLMIEGYNNHHDYQECIDIVKKQFGNTDSDEDDISELITVH